MSHSGLREDSQETQTGLTKVSQWLTWDSQETHVALTKDSQKADRGHREDSRSGGPYPQHLASCSRLTPWSCDVVSHRGRVTSSHNVVV